MNISHSLRVIFIAHILTLMTLCYPLFAWSQSSEHSPIIILELPPDVAETTNKTFEEEHKSADYQYRIGLKYNDASDSYYNPTKAAEWFEKAARQAHIEAQFELAQILLKGTQGEPNVSKALLWCQRAAYSDHLGAIIEVSNLYRRGHSDSSGVIEKDLAKALYWNGRRGELGDAFGFFMQGRIYESGELDAPDYVMAREKYLKAAEQNHALSQKAIGDLYREGLGVERDANQALSWYKKSYANGNGSAIGRIEAIEAEQTKKFKPSEPKTVTAEERGELIGTILKTIIEESGSPQKSTPLAQAETQNSCLQTLSSSFYYCETYMDGCDMGGCDYSWSCREAWHVKASNGEISQKVAQEKRSLGQCRKSKNHSPGKYGDLYCDPLTGKRSDSYTKLAAKVCR